VAFILQPLVTARLFLPPMRTRHEEALAKMMKFVRQIMVVAIMAFVSVGAFGQRGGRGQDKRPPKDPAKVIDKKDTRPPSNSNRHDKKKPFFGED
jgi:hypothetical protein